MNRRIEYTVGFKSDTSGIQSLKQELNSLSQMKLNNLIDINPTATLQDLEQIKSSVAAVQTALDRSYNLNLDSTNIVAFRQELSKSGQSLSQIQANLSKAGVQGQLAFKQMATELLTTNTQLKKSHSLLNSMAETISNTFKWSIASSAINAVGNSIRQAWGYTKALDSSLNDIRIVTGKSAEEMDVFAKKANKAAKALGSATKEYSNAALIYYQQGLDEEDVQARTDVTIKAANVTGQSAAQVSEQLTAVWNGYRVVAEEAESYIDKLAAVAASTASDLEELSEGMSKVASGASAMGVNIDQLTAQLSTIISVTRQDASSIGTALKTIFARMGDLKVDGVDEFGVSLGEISGTLKKVGVDVLDQQGNLRDMGTVMEEVAGKWGTWTEAQQQAVAVAMAGKRQYNNLLALFENWDMYESALTTSQGSEGTLQKQQDIYMDSLEGHLNQLSVAGEKVYDALFDSESMKDLIDILTFAVERFADFTDAIGGGGQLLANFGAIAFMVFKKQIAGGIATAMTNMTNFYSNTQAIGEEIAMTQDLMSTAQREEIPGLQEIVKMKQEELSLSRTLTAEEKAQFDNNIKVVSAAQDKLTVLKEQSKELEKQKNEANKMLEEKGIVAAHQGRDEKGRFTAKQLDEDISTEEGIKNASEAVDNRIKLVNKMATNPNSASVTMGSTLSDKDVSMEDKTAAAQKYADTGEGSLDADIKNMQDSGFSEESMSGLIQASNDLQQCREKLSEATKNAESAEAELLAKQKELYEATRNGLDTTAQEQAVLEAEQKAQEANNKVTVAGARIRGSAAKAAEEYQKAVKKERNELEKLNTVVKNNAKEQQKNTQAQKIANKELQNATNNYKRFLKEARSKAVVNNIMSVVGGLTQVASAITTLKNLGDIINDEDMSQGEKALAIIQNIGMALPMLVGGLGGVATLFQNVGSAQAKATAISQAYSADQMRQIMLTDKLTDEQREKMLTDMGLATSEEIKQNGIEKTINSLNKEQLSQLLANGLTDKATKGNIQQAITEKTKGQEGEKAGIKLFLAGIKAQLGFWPLLVIGLAIAAVLATIIALCMIFGGKQESELEKANKALKKEQEALTALNENYKKLNEELNNIRDSFDALEEKQKILNELTVGSQEWNEALRANNDQVMELLEKYPQLAAYISTDKNGQLSISQEGQDALIKAQQEKINKAAAAKAFQQQEVLKAKNNVLAAQEIFSANTQEILTDAEVARRQELQRQNGGDYDTNMTKKDIQVLDENGNVVTQSKWVDNDTKHINSVSDLTKDHGNQALIATSLAGAATNEQAKQQLLLDQQNGLLDKSIVITDALVNSMMANRDTLYANTTAMMANSQAIALLNEQMAASYFADDEDRENALNAQTFDRIAGAKINEATQSSDKLISENGKGAGDDRLKQDALEAYAESLGVSSTDLEYIEKDGVARVKIKGESDDSAITVSDAAEIAAKQLAANEVALQAGTITKVVNAAYKGAENLFGTGNANTFASIAGGAKGTIDTSVTSLADVDKLTGDKGLEANLDSILAKVAEVSGIKTNQEGWQDLAAQELEMKDAQAYYDAAKTTVADIRDTVNKSVGGMFSRDALTDSTGQLKAAYKNVSIDGLKTISSALNQAFKTGGEEGANSLQTLLEDLGDDPETQQKMAEIASGIDFSESNAMDLFKTQLREAGIETEVLGEKWDAVVVAMSKASNSSLTMLTNFSKVRDTVKEINSIAADLQTGDVISDEEYDKIVKENSDAANLFMLTDEGRKFVGNSGKQITDMTLGKYDNLEKTFETYQGLNSSVQAFASNDQWANGVSVSAAADTNVRTAQALLATDGWKELISAQGNVSADAFQKAISILTDPNADVSSEEYLQAKETLSTGLTDANNTIVSYKDGSLDDEYQKNQELWATNKNRTFAEIEDAREKGYLDEETYQKAETYWKNNYATQLGFEEGYSSSLGAKELEEHLNNMRALELDYYQQAEAKINELGNKIEKAFGADKIALMNEQIKIQEESLNLANKQAEAAKNSFAAMSEDFLSYAETSLGVDGSSLMTNGELDLNKLLDLQLNYEEGSAEFNNIQNLIDMWGKVEDSATKAADAANDLIDSQINAFNAETDMILSLQDTQNEWRKFIKSFQGFANGLKGFEEESSADIINRAFEDYDALSKEYSTLSSHLSSFGGITDNYLAHYAGYIAIEKDLKDKQQAITDAKIALESAEATKAQDKAETEAETAFNTAKYNYDTISKYIKETDAFKKGAEKIAQEVLDTQQKYDADKAAYDKAVAERDKANVKLDEARKKQQSRQNDYDAISSKANKEDLDKAISATKQAEDAANSAETTASSLLTTATQSQTAYTNALEVKTQYDSAIEKQKEAEESRLKALQNYADVLGVNIKNDKGELLDYDSLKAAVDSANKTTFSGDIKAAEQAVEDAEKAAGDAKKAKDNAIKLLSTDNPYATIVNGELVWDEERFNEDFNNYLTQAQDKLTEMRETQQEMYDAYLSAQDELMEIFDKEIEKLSSMNSIIQGSIDLWSIAGKNVDGYSTKINGYYDSMSANLGKSYELAQQKMGAAMAEIEKLQDENGNWLSWVSDEMIETVSNNLQTATEEVLSTASEWLTMITESFSAKMTNAIDDFVKQTAGVDLAGVTQDWGLATSEDDRYLDQVNATYGISSLMRKFDKSIDSTDSYTAQKKLAEQRAKQEERLNKILEERGKLSQYELDRANAEYELTLKQIALEEAQQTATKMKLTRDASGNYSYQYVQDQDAVAQAQEELEKAQNDLYNLDKDRNKELVDEYYNTMSEANDAIAEAMAQGDHERAARLREMYFDPNNGILAGIQQEIAAAEENFTNIGEMLGGEGWSSGITKFSQAIKDANLNELSENIKKLVVDTSTQLSDIISGTAFEEGILGIEDGLAAIDTLLSEDGAIGSMLKSSTDLAADTTEVTDAINKVIDPDKGLPVLVTSLNTLVEELDGYGQKYQEWLKSQIPEDQSQAIKDNTTATQQLTNAMYNYLDKLDGAENGTYEKNADGDWMLVTNAGGDNPST